jgi:hypothetical protein
LDVNQVSRYDEGMRKELGRTVLSLVFGRADEVIE